MIVDAMIDTVIDDVNSFDGHPVQGKFCYPSATNLRQSLAVDHVHIFVVFLSLDNAGSPENTTTLEHSLPL